MTGKGHHWRRLLCARGLLRCTNLHSKTAKQPKVPGGYKSTFTEFAGLSEPNVSTRGEGSFLILKWKVSVQIAPIWSHACTSDIYFLIVAFVFWQNSLWKPFWASWFLTAMSLSSAVVAQTNRKRLGRILGSHFMTLLKAFWSITIFLRWRFRRSILSSSLSLLK